MDLLMKRYIVLFLLLCLPGLAFAVPAIQHWTTKNGARVYFTPALEIPIVDVRVVFDAGSARDDDKPGLAVLTNGLLIEGAGKLDANRIAERFDDVGAQTGSGALRDMAWISVRTLSEEKVLRETMGVMALVLAEPTFPRSAFGREKKRMLVNIQAGKQRPAEIAERAFMQAVYGSHPYATSPGGNEASVQRINLKDVRAFYQQYYVANNAVITIVGDLSRLKAEALAEVLSGGLKSGEKAAKPPEVTSASTAKTIYIDHPSSQTHIWVGQPGVTRGDPDYFPLYIGNHTLGGSGLVSLLSDEVREKRGFAYSVYSYFVPMRVAGPYEMALQTKNQHAQDALNVMQQTAQKFIQQGITDEQLLASKRNITGGFALRLDSNKKLLGYLAMIGFYELPLDYLNTFNSKVEAVTVEQVKEAFIRRVKPEEWVTVMVGSRSIAEQSDTADADSVKVGRSNPASK